MPAPLFTLEERCTAHALELFEALRDPQLYKYLGEEPPASVGELATKLARSESRLSPDGKEHWLNWVVRVQSGQIAGYVQATVEATNEVNVAYLFSADFQGQGIATQAVRRMLDIVASEHQVTAFFIVTEAENLPSVRLAQRLGFLRAPTLVSATRQPSLAEAVYWRPGGRSQ